MHHHRHGDLYFLLHPSDGARELEHHWLGLYRAPSHLSSRPHNLSCLGLSGKDLSLHLALVEQVFLWPKNPEKHQKANHQETKKETGEEGKKAKEAAGCRRRRS